MAGKKETIRFGDDGGMKTVRARTCFDRACLREVLTVHCASVRTQGGFVLCGERLTV